MTTRPLIVESLAETVRHATLKVAVPSTWILRTVFRPWPIGCVLGVAPGCVYPSIVTGDVTGGRAVAMAIVWTPLPTMLNAIVSGPGFALASRIAWRSEPGPVSAVAVTV